jgi:hypothetical protein
MCKMLYLCYVYMLQNFLQYCNLFIVTLIPFNINMEWLIKAKKLYTAMHQLFIEQEGVQAPEIYCFQ